MLVGRGIVVERMRPAEYDLGEACRPLMACILCPVLHFGAGQDPKGGQNLQEGIWG